MLPLSLVSQGEEVNIKRIIGNPQIKKHLENLGFVPGTNLTIINQIDGNMIVIIKQARIAISKEMAQKIMV